MARRGGFRPSGTPPQADHRKHSDGRYRPRGTHWSAHDPATGRIAHPLAPHAAIGRTGAEKQVLSSSDCPASPGKPHLVRSPQCSTERPSNASGMIFRAWSRTNAATAASESSEAARLAIRSHC